MKTSLLIILSMVFCVSVFAADKNISTTLNKSTTLQKQNIPFLATSYPVTFDQVTITPFNNTTTVRAQLDIELKNGGNATIQPEVKMSFINCKLSDGTSFTWPMYKPDKFGGNILPGYSVKTQILMDFGPTYGATTLIPAGKCGSCEVNRIVSVNGNKVYEKTSDKVATCAPAIIK